MTILQSFSVQHVVASGPQSHLAAIPARREAVNVILGEPFPAVHLATGVMRSAVPFDFPATAPVYVLSRSAVPKWSARIRDWGALACDADDLSMKPALKASGAYRGPGFAAVFRDGWIADQAPGDLRRQFQTGLAILLYEGGHWLCRPMERQRSQRRWAAKNAAIAAYWNSTPKGHPAWQHDGPWIRAALHLHHRVNAVCPLDLADCRIAGDYYGLPAAAMYRFALAGELQDRGHEPIGRILTTDPPAMFAGFWSEDNLTRQRERLQ